MAVKAGFRRRRKLRFHDTDSMTRWARPLSPRMSSTRDDKEYYLMSTHEHLPPQAIRGMSREDLSIDFSFDLPMLSRPTLKNTYRVPNWDCRLSLMHL